jgi:hypothetical protein
LKLSLILCCILSNLLLNPLSYADQNKTTLCRNDPFMAQGTGDNAYTWTLTSKLAQILRSAEQRYGQRNQRWTLLGIEFSNDKQPKVWYPYAQQGEKFIIVQLTQAARCNPEIALFQLSHEVIHLLSPIGGRTQSNVFEEGLASYFSLETLKKQGYKVTDNYIVNKDYQAAYQAIASLYRLHPNSDTVIKNLRKEIITFKQLTPQQLQEAFPKISRILVQQLLHSF